MSHSLKGWVGVLGVVFATVLASFPAIGLWAVLISMPAGMYAGYNFAAWYFVDR